MTLSFLDQLGPPVRPSAVQAALEAMAVDEQDARGAVYTTPAFAEAVLDLAGYVDAAPLARCSLLEPSFGNGAFLLPAVERLLASWNRNREDDNRTADIALCNAIRGFELNRESWQQTREATLLVLLRAGLSEAVAQSLVSAWLHCDDFLLADVSHRFDFVVGNPPYIRPERVPTPLLEAYRARYRTMYDRADIYVAFFERGLDLLAPEGKLAFICADRWTKNKYGSALRRMVSERFRLEMHLTLDHPDAFDRAVLAYPAISVLSRPTPVPFVATPTVVGSLATLQLHELPRFSQTARIAPELRSELTQLDNVVRASEPWLLESASTLGLVRRLERTLPTLEEAGCNVGIGVASGADRVFVGPFASLPVEPDRKLPLAMAKDLRGPLFSWGGLGIVNPYDEQGNVVALEDFPLLREYFNTQSAVLRKRHVARKSPHAWYRTIDKIHPSLTGAPKLLIPDIKGDATVAFDAGTAYPHHNLYHVTSRSWCLRALQAVLRSSISRMFVATYCTQMAGGFLRFQAQYLRRIRLPLWSAVAPALAERLRAVAEASVEEVDAVVFELYGLDALEQSTVLRHRTPPAQSR